MLHNNKKNNRGFTLVEMLVAIAVFMTVMTVAVGSLTSIIEANRKAQSIKSVIDNVTFAIETISRDMRVSNNYKCSVSTGNLISFTDSCVSGGEAIQYKKNDTTYIQYQFLNTQNLLNPGDGNLQRRVCSPDPSSCPFVWQSMTAPTSVLEIKNMKFYVLGTDSSSQPRVLITAEGTAGQKSSDKTEFNLQTSVSQRLLNN